MILPLPYLIGLFATVIGLWTSWKLHKTRLKKKKLVCPLRMSCHTVVSSTFSETFGAHNDTLGIIYFALVTLLLVTYFFIMTSALLAVIFICTSIGVLFSIFLSFLQAFQLKAWCSWCILVALSNILLWISVLTLFISTFK